MFKLHTSGIYNFQWFNKLSQILDSCNFSNLWINQTQYTTKRHLKPAIFSSLDNLEKQKWLNEVNTSNFCITYRIFKQDLKFENYLIKLPFFHRLNFSKFRCKNNKLPINKYRFDKTNIDKSCQLCNIGDLGDEFHYLFKCKHFEKDRKLFLAEYYFKRPNTLKMNELFNLDDIKTLINLCKFIKIILDKFH